LVEIPGADHAVHLRLPAAFAEVIRSSVQRLLPSAQ
jgi:pimeloyl-ACP methyl ester carboxylesterase